MHSIINSISKFWQSEYLFLTPCLIVLTLLIGCGSGDGDSRRNGDGNVVTTVEITRDDRGVWFIKGTKDASLHNIFEAMGYAVATDRLWQAETYRRAARGRLAEILGSTQVPVDIFMRTTGYSTEELEAIFTALDAESQTILQAYVAGFNRRIAELREKPDLLPFEFKALGMQPENWTAPDLVAAISMLLRNFDPEGNLSQANKQIENAALLAELTARYPDQGLAMFNDLRWLDDPDALLIVPSSKPPTAAVAARPETQATTVTPSPLGVNSSLPDLSMALETVETYSRLIRENLEKINALVSMGSYAWVVAGSKTTSGLPVLYSGPQTGFPVPATLLEGSIQAGDLDVSGATVAGVPAILIGRTPRHAWALMVGHARTADFYLENPLDVTLHRMETIKVKGGEDVALPVFRTSHGPVINPMPYNPETYVPSPANPIITWKYSQRGYELDSVRAFIDAARSKNVDEFGIAVDRMGLSLHILYADQDSNIAYWMSGRNPVRPPGEYRFPQGFLPNAPVLEWDATVVEPRVHDRNPSQGFYGGWNNKSSIDAESSINNFSYWFGPFHRAQVIVDYLEMNQQFTFEELRDLALNIATVDSFNGQAGGDANDVFRGVNGGGNPWKWVSATLQSAVQANPSPSRLAAMELMTDWDGHFIAGGPSQWVSGVDRADAWILLEAWLREVLRLTFADELGDTTYLRQQPKMLFNVLLHGMKGASSGIVNQYRLPN